MKKSELHPKLTIRDVGRAITHAAVITTLTLAGAKGCVDAERSYRDAQQSLDRDRWQTLNLAGGPR